jgi:hypothetical protein
VAQESANLNAAARSPEHGHGHDTLRDQESTSLRLLRILRPFCCLRRQFDSSCITLHGHFHRDTEDASLRCNTESLLDPKLLETLRLDGFYLSPFSPTPMP